MKKRIFFGALVIVIVLAACRDAPISASYQVVLPDLPAAWGEIPGAPHWRLEWVDGDGFWQEREIGPGKDIPALPLIQEWTTPVLAWPFWPDRNLHPGTMRPSGALFPWDVSGKKITLSWRGGVDAVFWKELALAERSSAVKRLSWYFDWPRFRELFSEEGTIPENVRRDPWLPDWKEIAGKTVASGFDRRRIVSRKFTELVIPDFGGLWAGSSPFALPIEAPPGGPLRVKVAATPEAWVSGAGMLKCSASGWVWQPWL